MDLVIAKMRADFALVAAARRKSGDWSAEDERDAGLAIRAAIEDGDAETIACWSRWLAGLSARDLAAPAGQLPVPAAARSCRSCRHFVRPGLSDGHCAGREDLARVYGANHPLRVLPDDGGASCARWEERK